MVVVYKPIFEWFSELFWHSSSSVKVNGAIGILIFQPSGITISITKSSIAIYKTSSIFGLSLWISSINKTSPSSKLLSIEIISAGLLIAYQVIALIFLSICFAIILAIVVFPKPLGPENKVCQILLSLFCALSIVVWTTSLMCSWPIKSSKSLGLLHWEISISLSTEIFLTSMKWDIDRLK